MRVAGSPFSLRLLPFPLNLIHIILFYLMAPVERMHEITAWIYISAIVNCR